MNQIVKGVSGWLIKHNAIEPGDRELYEYALYSFLLSVTPLAIFLIVSGVMGMFWEGVLIVFPFMIIRKFAGGYHAKHAWVCMAVSTVLLGICLYLVAHIAVGYVFHLIVFTASFSIILHSPIDSENRRLSESEIMRYIFVTHILVMCMTAIYGILTISFSNYYACCVGISILLTALLQVPCVIGRIRDGIDSGKRKSFGQSEVVRCGKERGTAGGRNDRGSEIKKT